MNKIKGYLTYAPGIFIALIIAVIAVTIENLLPIHIIGGSVIALFLGMLINYFKKPNKMVVKGLKFTSKRLLKVAIILLGSSLSVSVILQVGASSLIVMCFTLATCFGGGYIVGKLLKLNWKTSNLISAGTGICGGSAIAALSPVIEAEDKDIAIAMSATFLFDMIMIVVFPILGRAMNLSDFGFGLWAGTAVNDTSSVVATGLAYSDAACEYATMVKLTRTLSIIPVVIIFAIINSAIKKREGKAVEQTKKEVQTVTTVGKRENLTADNLTATVGETTTVGETAAVGETTTVSETVTVNESTADNAPALTTALAENESATELTAKSATALIGDEKVAKSSKMHMLKIFPWFILGFLAMAILNSFGVISQSVSTVLVDVSKFMFVMALAAIGLNTNINEMKSAGARPMIHGFIISLLVVVVAISVQYAFNLM